MNENETSSEALPEVTVNMYPSVKEQVATTALVSLVSIAIPVAVFGVMAGVGAVVTKAKTWRENRKAKKEALWLPSETAENE